MVIYSWLRVLINHTVPHKRLEKKNGGYWKADMWSLALLLIWLILTLALSCELLCLCKPPLFFFFVSMFGMSVFLRAIQKKIIYLLQWFWRMLIMALAMLLFQEAPAHTPPACPPPCLLALASFPSPSSHFLPLSRAMMQAIVSACAKWRGGKGSVGWGQMHKGWDFLKCISCQQKDTFSHSSRADLHLLLLDPAEGFQPQNVPSAVLWSPSKHESQNCWQEGEKEKGIY